DATDLRAVRDRRSRLRARAEEPVRDRARAALNDEGRVPLDRRRDLDGPRTVSVALGERLRVGLNVVRRAGAGGERSSEAEEGYAKTANRCHGCHLPIVMCDGVLPPNVRKSRATPPKTRRTNSVTNRIFSAS